MPVGALAANPYCDSALGFALSLDLLSESIALCGLLQPLLVVDSRVVSAKTVSAPFMVVDGHARLAALVNIGIKKAPIMVLEATRLATVVMSAYAVNCHRAKSNSALNEALSFNAILEDHVFSSTEALSYAVGRSAVSVTEILRVTTLPSRFLQSLYGRPFRVGVTFARSLLRYRDRFGDAAVEALVDRVFMPSSHLSQWHLEKAIELGHELPRKIQYLEESFSPSRALRQRRTCSTRV